MVKRMVVMMRMALYAIGGIVVLALLAGAGWVYYVNNVEQPKYTVVTADGAFEVRDYGPLVVAEVVTRGDRKRAVNAGFSPLAGYIFAREREGEAIAMTAPVTQRRSSDAEGTWSVQFIMPSRYSIDRLPRPAGSEVSLKILPASRRAVVRFSGVATDELIAEREGALRTWVAARGFAVTGAPTFAYYNDPFTPGPLRRNEVMLDLVVAK